MKSAQAATRTCAHANGHRMVLTDDGQAIRLTTYAGATALAEVELSAMRALE